MAPISLGKYKKGHIVKLRRPICCPSRLARFPERMFEMTFINPVSDFEGSEEEHESESKKETPQEVQKEPAQKEPARLDSGPSRSRLRKSVIERFHERIIKLKPATSPPAPVPSGTISTPDLPLKTFFDNRKLTKGSIQNISERRFLNTRICRLRNRTIGLRKEREVEKKEVLPEIIVISDDEELSNKMAKMKPFGPGPEPIGGKLKK